MTYLRYAREIQTIEPDEQESIDGIIKGMTQETATVEKREGGITGDSPGRNPEETQAVLGDGPGIFLYDSSTLPNRRFVALVDEVARAKGIPLQHDLVQGYGDDSAAIQATNGGVPTVNLVVPARYTMRTTA